MSLPELPEPAAHIYPSDLEKFKTSETFATAYSVAVGCPDERSVPVFTLSDLVAYAAAAVAAALNDRMAIHAESSRIYANLASVVRSGADDATLARELRNAIRARSDRSEVK
jgi:hypothetical protein